MSNYTVKKLKEIYESRNGPHKDLGWSDDPAIPRSGMHTLFIRESDGSVTLELHERGKRTFSECFPDENTAVRACVNSFMYPEGLFG